MGSCTNSNKIHRTLGSRGGRRDESSQASAQYTQYILDILFLSTMRKKKVI